MQEHFPSNPSVMPHKTTNFRPEHPPRPYADVAEEGMERQQPTENNRPRKPSQYGVKPAIANLNGDANLVNETPSADGSYLTSTREPEGYEVALAQDKKEWKHVSQQEQPEQNAQDVALVSGRKVGQRWHQSAIRFAPLNVPLQRRLQTTTVLFHALSITLLLAIFFGLCTIPILWPILIPYLIYTLMSQASVSGELSHRSEWCRKSPTWSLFASYFPARLHRSQELPSTRKYVFGYHPHGIIAHGKTSLAMYDLARTATDTNKALSQPSGRMP